jgi:sugar phosphate isomerase/epimerase
MKLSMGSWVFSFGPYADHPVPFDDIARRLSTAGYEAIEICGFPPHITLDEFAAPEKSREKAAFLAGLNLEVSGYLADLSSVNPAVASHKQKYLDLFQANVGLAAALGSPSIRVDTVAAPNSVPDSEYREVLARVAALWREAAAIAAGRGLRVVWEFEPGFLFNKPSEVVAMHDAVGHPNFTILFDTSHAYMCSVAGARQHGHRETLHGGVVEFLKKLAGRIGHIHIIDSDGTLYAEETSTHRPFGEGRIDFRKLTPHLLALPGIEWWCLDLCFWAGAWELVDSSRAFVRALLANAMRAA